MNGIDLAPSIQRANELLAGQRWGEAVHVLRRILIVLPNWTDGSREFIRAIAHEQAPTVVSRLLRQSSRMRPDDDRLHKLAMNIAYRIRNLKGVRIAARRVAALDPASHAALGMIALVATNGKDHLGAEAVHDRMKCVSPLTFVDLQARLFGLLDRGLLSRAEPVARRLLIEQPNGTTAVKAMARILSQRRRREAAYRWCTCLQVLRPVDPDVLCANARITLVCRMLGTSDRFARRAILIRPNMPEAYIDLARPSWKREDREVAEVAIARAAIIEPAMALRGRILRLTATRSTFARAVQRNNVSTPV